MTDAAGGDEKFHGSLIRVRVQPVEVAPGRTVPFEIVEHPDAVAIVALRWERPDDPNVEPLVALVRLRRPAVGEELWEIPAGLVEPGEREEPQRTAERELREETGATAAQWKLLTRE
jgi:ADP-ribose pyrophosphatase